MAEYIDQNAVRAFIDTTDWEQPRVLEKLPLFIEKFSLNADEPKELYEAPQGKGMPHTIVVTAAGLRAADITRYTTNHLSPQR